MSEHRFLCTACGACCYGLLPLTLNEAVSRAHQFPLAMTITVVKPGAQGYRSAEKFGVSIVLHPRKKVLLLVSAVSFIPPSMPCPELGGDKLCSIHLDKPVRCKAMPFHAYKDEDHQRDLLIPRPNWECETGPDAPVVYRDRKIVNPTDFDDERLALREQTSALQRYVELMLKYDSIFSARIARAAQSPLSGRAIAGFVSYLRYNNGYDLTKFAKAQQPVLKLWAQKTSGDPKLVQFHTFYQESVADLERYVS